MKASLLIFLFCFYFTLNGQSNNDFTLIGKWKLEKMITNSQTVFDAHDTLTVQQNNLQTYWAMKNYKPLTKEDSAFSFMTTQYFISDIEHTVIEFKSDSTFIYSRSAIKLSMGKFSFNASNMYLTLNAKDKLGTYNTNYHVTGFNDSTLEMFGADSVTQPSLFIEYRRKK